MARGHSEVTIDPKIRSEYLKRSNKFQKEPIIKIGNSQEFRKRYELK